MPSALVCIDGNNSLKSIDNAFKSGVTRTDTRSFVSRRWIENEEVDQFKDDVKNSHKVRL